MHLLFWMIPFTASICMTYAATVQINDGTLMDILSELQQVKSSNELRDQRIADLEEQLIGQSARIAELELQLSECTQKAVPSDKRVRQVGVSPGVAFTAYMSNHAANLGHQYTIPFDSVILNEGQAFNISTHVFTCPVTGVYTFQTALLSQSQDISITEIVKEGAQLVQAHAESRGSGAGTYDQGFNAVVTKCTKGERVWVRNFQHFGSNVYSARYTTFTGYLLWEVEEFGIVG